MGAQISGRDVRINNQPIGFVSDINAFKLEDFAPIGWDIEVYRDNSLVAFGVVPDTGEYSFTNLNLQPGLNTFRILLYGPQGEQQERVQRFYLGGGMLPAQTFYYDINLLESAAPLIDVTETERDHIPQHQRPISVRIEPVSIGGGVPLSGRSGRR